MVHIYTHPYRGNFGGGLQAYALLQAIQQLGANADIIENISYCNYIADYNPSLRDRYRLLKWTIKLILGKMSYLPSIFTHRKAHLFKKKFMRMAECSKVAPQDAFIVGSDQVWRALYTRNLGGVSKYFLDFATVEQRQRSFAYAASFGSDQWEGTAEETDTCRQLIQDFKALSVRESSGIQLCATVFGREAVQMPDPTFLLQASDYNKLIQKSRTRAPKQKYIAAYVLDPNPDIRVALEKAAHEQNLYVQHLMPNIDAKSIRDRFPISIPQWLRYIRDAEYVVTDSFHGCVFSIILNKPFVCVGNEARGTARFNTLFKTFGLQQHLVHTISSKTLQKPETTGKDWENINAILASERDRGLCFLRQNLN